MSWYMIAAMKSLIAILEHIDTYKFLLLVYYIKVCFSSYTCAFGIAARVTPPPGISGYP